ncbi:proton-coupled folate transporter-like [Anopheles albimanus]|uniref:Adenylate cyclase n=1 Tax=Anopheles albimanus TaxID=7167 RepID=A0A182F248_ANOAL|nr:proton-coupled folate transporter-like [Anopheles albimanus]
MDDRESPLAAWCAKAKKYITIEPVIVLFLLTTISSTGQSVFEFEKACATKLNVSLEVCAYMSELEDDNICEEPDTTNRTMPGVDNFLAFRDQVCLAQTQAQTALAELDKHRNIWTGLVQVIVLLVAGSWTDRAGALKPCILVPIAAQSLSLLYTMLCAVFMREIPLEASLLVADLMVAVCGGVPLLIAGIYSYLALATEPKDRTFRFACAAVSMVFFPVVANFFSGYLFKALGFIKLCLVCLVFCAASLLYGLFVLEEPKPRSKEDASVATPVENEKQPAQGGLSSLFDYRMVFDSVKVVLRKRDFNRRNILWLTLLAFFVNFGALSDAGVAANLAISQFHWVTSFGMWRSYDLATTMLGTLLAMGVLSKRFGVSDAMVCVFSICFSMAAKPIMAYAVTHVVPNLYFVATSIDVFEGSKTIATKSLASKLVAENEIAKMLTLLGIVESLQVTIYPSLYSVVFLASQETVIGAVFWLSEGFLLLAFALYIVLYLMSRRSERASAEAATATEPGGPATQSSTKQGIDNPAVDITAL